MELNSLSVVYTANLGRYSILLSSLLAERIIMDFLELIKPGIISLKHHDDVPEFIGFSVNEWGSCQYSSALDTYNLMKALERNIGFWGALDIMKIKFKFNNLISFPKAKKQFVEYMEDYYTRDIWKDEKTKCIEQSKRVMNFNHMFEFCRDHAWDLWYTAPYIFDLMFDNNKLEFPYTDGEDFINFETGIKCWIMNSLLNISEDSFRGYDT